MFRQLTSGILLAASVFAPIHLRLLAQGLSFTHQLGGTSSSGNLKAAADSTGIYVVSSPGGGEFNGVSGTTVIRKYDSSGVELWTRQLNEISVAGGVAVSGAGIYVVGDTGWQPFTAG